MAGLPSFADGFSGGLNQGMGIMRQARQDALAQQQAAFQRTMALRQDSRAEAQEGRSAQKHEWESDERPLTMEKLTLDVANAKQNLENNKLDGQTKAISLEFLPKKLQAELTQTEAQTEGTRASTARTRQNIVLDRRQDARESAGLRLRQRADSREQEAHDMKVGAELMPYYTEMVRQGVPIPKEMEAAVKRSPFGIANLVENANASARFGQVLGRMGKGDWGWTQNADDRVAMASLARSRGMAMAGQRGMLAGSARVLTAEPGQGGTVNLTVAALNPKTNRYEMFTQAVNSDRLIGEMTVNARSGEALRNHPDWQDFSAKVGKLGRTGRYAGDVGKAAAQDYDAMFRQNMQIIQSAQTGANVPQSAIAGAQKWIEQYGNNRESFIQDYSGLASLANAARGSDTNSTDYSRVYSEAARHTRSFRNEDNIKHINGSLGIADKLESGRFDNDPELKKLGKALAKEDDPAARIRLVSEAWANPDTAARFRRSAGVR